MAAILTGGLLAVCVRADYAGWTYLQSVTLSPTTPVADYQVKVTLTPGTFAYAKCRSDGVDLRFATTNGVALSHWIETWNAAGSSVCWVKVPASGTSRLWLYYGNESAVSASSGNDTFDFFDDFSGDLSKWTVRFKKNAGAATIVNGHVEITGGQTSADYGWTALGTAGYSTFLDGIIEGKAYLGASAISEVGFRGSYTTATKGYKSRMDARSAEGLSHLTRSYDYPNWTQLGSPQMSGTPVGTVSWKPFTITVSGSSFTIACDGQTWTRTDGATTTAGDISLQNHYGNYTWYDDIRVRKYAAIEPAATPRCRRVRRSEPASG